MITQNLCSELYLLTGSLDSTVRHWDLLSGKCLHTWTQRDPVNQVAISSCGRQNIISTTTSVDLLDKAVGQNHLQNLQTYNDITAIATSKCGNYSLVAYHDNNVYLFELRTGILINKFIGHSDNVLAVAMSKNNKFVVSAGKDKFVKLFKNNRFICSDHDNDKYEVYNINKDLYSNFVCSNQINSYFEGELLLEQKHNAIVTSVVISPCNNQIISASIDGEINIVDMRQIVRDMYPNSTLFEGNFMKHSLNIKKGDEHIITLAVNHQQVIFGSTSGSANVQDYHKKFFVTSFVHSEHKPVTSVSLSTDGIFAVTGGMDHEVKLWDIHSGMVLKKYLGHEDSISSLALSLGSDNCRK